MKTHGSVFLENPLGITLDQDAVAARLSDATGWEGRYKSVLDLGLLIPALDSADCTDANRLPGCQAKVWVVHHYVAETDRLYFLCESDARIVKGLLACLLCLYNGRSPAQILDTDARPWLDSVGLVRHIASTRSNGLWALIGKIKAVASRY